MVVWRTPTGGLLLHSVICLREDAMAALDALGPVTHIVVPCEMHRTDAALFQERYPNALLLAPKCARAKVDAVVSGCEDLDGALAALNVTLHRPEGLKDFELHLELPLEDGSRALVMTDALFNLGATPPKGFGGFMVKLLGSVGPLGITKIGRRLLLQDAAAFAGYLQKLAQIENLKVLSVAHGAPVIGGVADALREASRRIKT